jgi:hypothetical protein
MLGSDRAMTAAPGIIAVDVVRALRTDLDLDEAATELRPVVDTVAPWHRIEQLQARMAAGHHLDKMVLEVPTTTS